MQHQGLSLITWLLTGQTSRSLITDTEQQRLQNWILQENGWDTWRDDPWGSFADFVSWHTQAVDELLALHTVNETAGRIYLSRGILTILSRQDYASLPEQERLERVGQSGVIQYYLKQIGGERLDFPQRGLSQGAIDFLVSLNWESPFQLYQIALQRFFDGRRTSTLKSPNTPGKPKKAPPNVAGLYLLQGWLCVALTASAAAEATSH